jgi:hypothetical protein
MPQGLLRLARTGIRQPDEITETIEPICTVDFTSADGESFAFAATRSRI